MSNHNVYYRVCPKCGNPLQLVNGIYTCRVCGYISESISKTGVSKF